MSPVSFLPWQLNKYNITASCRQTAALHSWLHCRIAMNMTRAVFFFASWEAELSDLCIALDRSCSGHRRLLPTSFHTLKDEPRQNPPRPDFVPTVFGFYPALTSGRQTYGPASPLLGPVAAIDKHCISSGVFKCCRSTWVGHKP